MRNRSILIMCNTDPLTDPGPNRMIRLLRQNNKLTVVSRRANSIKGTNSISLAARRSATVAEKLIWLARSIFRQYENIIWTEAIKAVKRKLEKETFHVIIVHDIGLLPLALSIRRNAKVLFDAREYYPKQFENSLFWHLFCQPLNKYLCRNFLRHTDYMITVSEGIAKAYSREYGVNPDVVMSLPDPVDLSPSVTNFDKIRIIHHGNANPARRIELMIEMMDYVDKRFCLDLMLVPVGSRTYYGKLKEMASKRNNVAVIPPTSFENIIRRINQYDIGLCFFPPSTFNLRHVLPNKFFEFIQARLAVAIGPSVEMKKIVQRHDCGVVSKSFDVRSLAEEINGLDVDKIDYYKLQSHKAASVLNSTLNAKRIAEIINHMDCNQKPMEYRKDDCDS